MRTIINIKKLLVTENLSFPTSICIDTEGNLFVAESGLSWDGNIGGGEILRILPNGDKELLI
jgi:hypothetical protein